MKHPQLSFIAALLGCLSAVPCLPQKAAPKFKYQQYPATVYHGKPQIPRGLHKTEDGDWSDKNGPVAFSPHVNFAGDYNLSAHTCGTCCRFYMMTNLRTGQEVKQVEMFNTERLNGDGEETSAKTRDGHTYVPELFYKPNSDLVIVQYHLDMCVPQKPETGCRQRYFQFQNGEFKPISNTLRLCTKEGDEPE